MFSILVCEFFYSRKGIVALTFHHKFPHAVKVVGKAFPPVSMVTSIALALEGANRVEARGQGMAHVTFGCLHVIASSTV